MSWIGKLSIQLCLGAGMLGASAPGRAQSRDDLTSMSLESLMDLQVSSVSRREEELHRTAAAVYVITREDIRRSGATDLADLLRIVPGMHVAQLNASVWAVSARGFASEYATKMLVLVDGRSVYHPSFSGVFWHLQNLGLADIERIEVIRGPGATMWGSNAVNGVISITTRDAADTTGGLVTVDAGTDPRGEGSARYGGRLGRKAFYRVFGRQTRRSTTEESDDAWRLTTGGLRLDWNPSSKDSLNLDASAYEGYQESRRSYLASLAPLAYETVGRTGNRGGHVVVRWARAVAEDSNLSLQLYYDQRRHTGYAGKDIHVLDLDLQHHFRLGERHQLTVGGGHRTIHDEFANTLAFGFAELHLDSTLSNVYLQDEISVVEDELSLTVGGKLERSSFTGYNFQPTMRLSWQPRFRHSIWGSVSRAVRTANRVERGMYVNVATFDAGPTLGVVTLYGREDTRSEELLAYELGYRYQSNRRLRLDVTGFYNVYGHLSTVEPGEPFFEVLPGPPHLVAPLYFGNEMEGETYGVEAAADYELHPSWSLRGSYSLRPLLRFPQLAVRLAELTGPVLDFFLEPLAVAEKLLVALLDLPQHLVETVDENGELLASPALRTGGEVVLRRDGFRDLGELEDWSGDDSLEPRRDEERDGKGEQGYRRGGGDVRVPALHELLEVALHVHRPQVLAV